MQREIAFSGFVLTLSCWLMVAATVSGGQSAPQRLKPAEYDSVALIYNQELLALGKRALFPICIGMPSGTSTKLLLQYLRNFGFEISDESVCEPAIASGGQHPKGYPHGLRIFFDNFQREQGRLVSIHVQSDDLTLRPGEHLAQTLRRGTYHIRQNEAGKWLIVEYTKEYDSED